MSVGVRAKSKVVLMNESETKRGNAHGPPSHPPLLCSSHLSAGVNAFIQALL